MIIMNTDATPEQIAFVMSRHDHVMMEVLERIIDKGGLSSILAMLVSICNEKAHYVAEEHCDLHQSNGWAKLETWLDGLMRKKKFIEALKQAATN